MQIKKFISRNETDIINISNILSIKYSSKNNEEMALGEVTFLSEQRDSFKMFDAVAINNINFDWYIISSDVKLKSKASNIYIHTLILSELTIKLKNYAVSNLSFKERLPTFQKKYNNMLDVFLRVIKLTPFLKELDKENRPILAGTSRLNRLLESTKAKEFKFVNRNLYEVMKEIFIELNGVPVLLENGILDIRLFNDSEYETVTIDNYYDYNEIKTANLYGNTAEITTNNLIDTTSTIKEDYKIVFNEDGVFDENDCILETEYDIYKLLKVEVAQINAQTYYDISTHVLEKDQYDILTGTTGGIVGDRNNPGLDNSLFYTQFDNKISNFGQTQKSSGIIKFDTIVWKRLFSDFGVPTTENSKLTDYKFRLEYEATKTADKFFVKTLAPDEDNKFSCIRINLGDRVNDFDKVTKLAQNKISRFGAKIIKKAVRVNTLDEIYELGTFDLDTQKFISEIDVEIINNSIKVTYTLVADLNILPENVGLNTVNRFTDVDLGSTLQRTENYTDNIVFSVKQPLNRNTTLLTDRAILRLSYILRNIGFTDGIRNKYAYIKSVEETELGSALKCNVSSSPQMTKINIPISSSIFTGNRIQSFGDRQLYRGVKYTDDVGEIDKLLLGFDYSVNSNPSEQIIRNLPLASEGNFLNLESEPLFELSDIEFDVSVENKLLTNFFVSGGISNANGSVSSTETEVFTTPQLLDNLKVTYNNALSIISGSPDNFTFTRFNITVKGKTELDNEITLLNTFSNQRNGEIIITFDVIELKEITVIFSTTYNVVGLSSSATATVTGSLTTDEKTIVASGDGLRIDKNADEILDFNYTLNNHSDSNIIIGSGFYNNSPFIKSSFSKFERIEIRWNTRIYNVYDTVQLENGNPIGLDLGELSGFYQAQKINNVIRLVLSGFGGGIDNYNAYAVYGYKNGEYELLYAVNRKNGELPNIIWVSFKKFGDSEITKY